ncbi:MAG TPA: antitoxin VapB family protein [Candidatus Thermoplasmatota archaeon]|nr:antitoxin VapB family protein [Candidatus Thermoplasmatota archaeon]
MGSKTISLEDSAYEKLKAAKRPGESFSGVIHRLMGDTQPSLLDFVGLVDQRTADEAARVVARMRKADLDQQRRRLRKWA